MHLPQTDIRELLFNINSITFYMYNFLEIYVYIYIINNFFVTESSTTLNLIISEINRWPKMGDQKKNYEKKDL